ncbi:MULTISPECIES: hypothetical protein [unclassified Streptomyces]|uniref:hypothetical protein n=1 Tax=unclassified Streptomyces TaxID=2593676 RepID=UPI002366A5BA|nr:MULTISPECIES: hypothetical protein [unclassified Streptomyces]MDF3142141.1 hypothetical protein [Streptomyces sp. T21Q-yed]WDF43578.1 hypothetical protein PBV52_45780 [Streptomyces sp. T12]
MGRGFSTTVEALQLRKRRLGPCQPTLVLEQLSAEDFHLSFDTETPADVAAIACVLETSRLL